MQPRWSAALAFVAAAAIMPAVGASAQSAPKPTPKPAITVPLQERNGSGVHGSVNVTPQGSGSSVQIQLSSPSPTVGVPSLKTGADCIAASGRAATAVPLTPISGGFSRTIVAIPFSAFRSHHFVVDVRNATASAQASQACARI